MKRKFVFLLCVVMFLQASDKSDNNISEAEIKIKTELKMFT